MVNTQKRIITELRAAVSNKLGKEILSSAHCDMLADEISKIGVIINPQTFRRFFGLIKNSGKFHIHTLDTLAQYCGFTDFKNFGKSLTENELDLFLGSHDSSNLEYNYWQLSENLCRKIIDSPSSLAIVHHQLLKYPLARTFFMEHHPMRDLAGTVYAQYFQDYLKYEQSNEAKLFAYGFLYMGSFLTENKEFMEIYFHKIKDTELSPEVYVLPAARKFGVKLLHYWLNKDEQSFTETYVEMLEARNTYKEISEKSVCSFEYVILEHLIFTDKTEEMKFLIGNNTQQKYSDREFVPQDRKENHDVCWNIMCAVAYLKSEKFEECKNYLDKVCLESLSLGWQKYYSIIYYFVKLEFAAKNERTELLTKLTQLINQTYFTYYDKALLNLQNKNLKSESLKTAF